MTLLSSECSDYSDFVGSLPSLSCTACLPHTCDGSVVCVGSLAGNHDRPSAIAALYRLAAAALHSLACVFDHSFTCYVLLRPTILSLHPGPPAVLSIQPSPASCSSYTLNALTLKLGNMCICKYRVSTAVTQLLLYALGRVRCLILLDHLLLSLPQTKKTGRKW